MTQIICSRDRAQIKWLPITMLVLDITFKFIITRSASVTNCVIYLPETRSMLNSDAEILNKEVEEEALIEVAQPHYTKLNALLKNPKLPSTDVPMVKEALVRYKEWKSAMDGLTSTGERLLIELLALLR